MKTPKNLIGKKEKHMCWVKVFIKFFLHFSQQCHNHPLKKKIICGTRSARVGSIMMTWINVQMSSTNITMTTHPWEDSIKGGERMWVYSCNTWNLTSLVMDAKKKAEQRHEMQFFAHHEHNKKDGSPWDLMTNRKCNVSNQEPKDKASLI